MSSGKLELPEDLSEDMEVLFVNPYPPEESARLERMGATTKDLTDLFQRMQAQDPGFQNFEDTVGLIKTVLKLGGYVVGDDLIVLYGDKVELEKAQEQLQEKYTCFFETLGAFLAHTESEDAVVTIKGEDGPTLH